MVRRDPRRPLLRELARRGLTREQLQRAAGLPLAWLREMVEGLRAVA